MFNSQELKILQQFLSRVDLKGTEAQNHVYLTQKINGLIKELEDAESAPEPEEEEVEEEETDDEE